MQRTDSETAIPCPPTRHAPPLPTEVWILVAQYLTTNQIYVLSSLNYVFYSLAMDTKYHEMEFSGLSVVHFLRKVECLRLHYLAERVHILTIDPDHTWNALNPAKPPSTSMSFRLLRHSRHAPGSSLPSRLSSLYFKSSLEKRTAMTDMARKLVNVKDLTITSWPEINGRTLVKPCCPILASFLPANGHNLSSLTLAMTLSTLGGYISSSPVLSGLEKLAIKVNADTPKKTFHHINWPQSNSEHTVGQLAGFINASSTTLTSLSIDCFVEHRVSSSFFNALKLFPLLVKLSLSARYDSHHFPDPSGINRLLVGHASLRDLTIMLKDCHCSDSKPSSYGVVSAWWRQCFEGIACKDLQSFHLNFGLLSQPFNVDYLQPLQRISRSLTSLNFFGQDLDLWQVRKVLTMFYGPFLETLSLDVYAVTPELFELLATMCPDLRRLNLHTSTLAVDDSSFDCDAVEFLAAMATQRKSSYIAALYSAWQLDRLQVWVWSSLDDVLQQPLLNLIKNS